ncbi:RNA polymerase sigma factor [Algoriphagus zhangzhouensis]|uniref:RNA polymerase sigma-70 factor, ECF subfamily n=1 Tax=Algoriphagus zhangzhouensis TaxID=1073327 RepID=A0A1M7Z3I5_9BACT|nr:sigma-70 family RNA polymerase sigma factor [Algoriphagus zhangzhouensis]TDY48451.1 RNA polymerase sigma-70 factor (ECF subfamily) [Algoriphagus zhangzhouensis]SHO59498.1 RNA polymerase sigma-70 factor, ECF subfamily [Algoriphagus zhangzhouensis]
MEEQEIIAGLRSRDRATTEYLYEKYSRALFAVISRIISDQTIAEEVFHDSFIKITRKIDLYDESKGRLYTWMANICRNKAIDKLRSKEISQTTKTNTIDDFVFGLESQSETKDHVDGIGVRELMDQLNTDQKFIIEYIYFQGYTHSEISEEFDIPLGTVKSRVRAALQVLKKNSSRI